jgi:hypothetical protein
VMSPELQFSKKNRTTMCARVSPFSTGRVVQAGIKEIKIRPNEGCQAAIPANNRPTAYSCFTILLSPYCPLTDITASAS